MTSIADSVKNIFQGASAAVSVQAAAHPTAIRAGAVAIAASSVAYNLIYGLETCSDTPGWIWGYWTNCEPTALGRLVTEIGEIPLVNAAIAGVVAAVAVGCNRFMANGEQEATTPPVVVREKDQEIEDFPPRAIPKNEEKKEEQQGIEKKLAVDLRGWNGLGKLPEETSSSDSSEGGAPPLGSTPSASPEEPTRRRRGRRDRPEEVASDKGEVAEQPVISSKIQASAQKIAETSELKDQNGKPLQVSTRVPYVGKPREPQAAPTEVGVPVKPSFVDVVSFYTHHYSHEEKPINGKSIGLGYDLGTKRSTVDDRAVRVGGRAGTHSYELFAIFDGDNGPSRAEFLQKNLQKSVGEALGSLTEATDREVRDALTRACGSLDDRLQSILDSSVSTATIAFRFKGDLWIVNVGNSQAILRKKEGTVQEGVRLVAEEKRTSYFGTGSLEIFKIGKDQIEEGDILILVTESIANVASEKEIADRVGKRVGEKKSTEFIAIDLVGAASTARSRCEAAMALVIPL